MTDTPEIALLVPPAESFWQRWLRLGRAKAVERTNLWADLANHLLTCIGLPQVAIVEAGTPLPASVHSVVIFGPDGWRPRMPRKRSVNLWRLDPRTPPVAGDFEAVLSDGQRVKLPGVHTVAVIDDGRVADNPARKLQQVLFWLGERLAKGSGRLSQRDFREWELLLHIVGGEADRSDYWKGIASNVKKRGASADTSTAAIELAPLTRKAALASPDLLAEAVVRVTALEMAERRLQLVDLVRDVFAHSNTGYRLIAVGVCALLLGDQQTAQAVRDRLGQDEWGRKDVAFPFLRPGRAGFCYSPLVAMWYLLEARQLDPAFRIPEGTGVPMVLARPLPWRPVGNDVLVNAQKRLISRSLVDNWRTLHSAPCPFGSQYKLDAPNYRPLTATLEELWLDVFRLIQNGSGRSLVRLKPWPAPFRAAFSMRYDVDRPVSAERIDQLVDIQSKCTNALFGSWYYFIDDPDLVHQADQLRGASQEVGRHLQRAHEATPGVGVTHHSAPTSDYWRGNATNAVLDELGVSYGEFFAGQIPTPRPAWISDHQGERLGRTWVTTIYFPLEGDTGNRTLIYFDKLIAEFRAMLATGGHVIVGSHPDVDQNPLARLLERESLSNVWFATVGDVVERCQRVLAPRAVRAVSGDRQGTIVLQSKEPLSDVAVELWHPGRTSPDLRCVQLTNGSGGTSISLDDRLATQ